MMQSTDMQHGKNEKL